METTGTCRQDLSWAVMETEREELAPELVAVGIVERRLDRHADSLLGSV